MPAKLDSTGDIARITLSGPFDFSSQGYLGDVMDQALGIDGVREIQVDMTHVTFIDSSVIRALLKLRESAIAAGKSLSIWNCNEQIREIFVIGGFDQMFVLR